jgi:hypothetical protein
MAEIITERGSLYVYTHWMGWDFPEMAKQAIVAARPRWDDPIYATHIIVDQLTKEGRDQETEFGLMCTPCCEDSYNGDSPSVIINLPSRILTVHGKGAGKWRFSELVRG